MYLAESPDHVRDSKQREGAQLALPAAWTAFITHTAGKWVPVASATMADLYELTLALDLRDDLTEQELAELRWHLGAGPQPETLGIVTEFPVVVEEEDGEIVIEDHPEPLLACHDAGYKVEGALVSVLLRKQGGGHDTWALTSRQEIHPDDFDRTSQLLNWLASKADERHHGLDGSVDLGWIRFYEARLPEPLLARDGAVVWPS
ncbi:DUF397 domain-containing protein [Streptomyces sp. NPDC052051]|uniref:DUF397 domain-containing protein n=1 Tax=Streptomyces sp. NPDC052051 TaxID=3154649 RepID=UPI0034280A56